MGGIVALASLAGVLLSLCLAPSASLAESVPIRTLSEDEVVDLMVGSSIVATRANDSAAMIAAARELLAEGKQFRMVALDDVPDDWTIVAAAGGIGGGGAWEHVSERMEKRNLPTLTSVEARLVAMDALSEHVGRKFDAVIRNEAAGGTLGAFQAAIARGLPVVDACPAGRAKPEVTQSIPFVNGILAAPMALVSRWGDVVLVDQAVDDTRVEDLARSVAVASGGGASQARNVMSGAEAKRGLIPGSLSQNILYGRTVREARERGDDPIEALVEVAGGFKLFQGVVTEAEMEGARGFSIWDVELQGVQEFAGHVYRVWVKNENIVGWLDGVPDAMSPDLISPLEPETGDAISGVPLGGYAPGSEVALVGIPAPPQWRVPKGIELLGPRHFGFDFDYVPLEELQSRRRLGR